MKKGLSVLPPKPGQCPTCAVYHPVEEPHDATSFYYQVIFGSNCSRMPTWEDAMSHCSQEVKNRWIKHLNKLGIEVDSTDVKGGMKSEEQLKARLKS